MVSSLEQAEAGCSTVQLLAIQMSLSPSSSIRSARSISVTGYAKPYPWNAGTLEWVVEMPKEPWGVRSVPVPAPRSRVENQVGVRWAGWTFRGCGHGGALAPTQAGFGSPLPSAKGFPRWRALSLIVLRRWRFAG